MSIADVVSSRSPSIGGSLQNTSLKSFSCLKCQQRKVKCNKRDPCSTCSKTRVECVFRTPAPPRRRKRKNSPERDLAARLKRYEELLKGYGANLDAIDDSDVEVEDKRRDTGFAIVVNSTRDVRSGSLLETGKRKGSESPRRNTGRLAGEPGTSRRYLEEYVMTAYRACDVMETDMPATYGLGLVTSYGNLDNVSKGTEALMFATYLSAVTSLDDADCETIFGETKPTLWAKYKHGAEHALISADLLKSSDLMILQAFVLFLHAVAQSYDPRCLWMLTGIAVRIGQRCGLHRDDVSGELSIFEIEMRRRLWWPLLILDSKTGQLSGSGTSILANACDTKLPLNVNDSDLDPSMKEVPLEHIGPTEMVFCLIRYHVGQLLSNLKATSAFDGAWSKLSNIAKTLTEKDKVIDEFEGLLERKFLRHCDPSIPLAFISTIMFRSTICKMRLIAHHPRQYPDRGASLTQKERDNIFSISLKMIEYDNLFLSTYSTKRFFWHAKSHPQMDAFVYAVTELLHRRITGELAERAWHEINALFEHRPNIIADIKNSLFVALCTLTLRAWESQDATLKSLYRISSETTEPPFISVLRSRRPMSNISQTKDPHATATPTLPRSAISDTAGDKEFLDCYQTSETLGTDSASHDLPIIFNGVEVDWSPIDWAYWDGLLQGHESEAFT